MNLTKKDIEHLYFEEKLSTRKIASQLGVSQSAIMKVLKSSDLRSKSEAADIRYESLKLKGSLADLAYLIGIYLGDGCLVTNSRTELLDIACDAKYPNIIQRYSNLVTQVFGKQPALHKDIISNCVHIRLYGKDISTILGFQPGPKKSRELRIPNWVVEEKHLSNLCIRGLFETDGYIHHRRGRAKSIVVGFSNTNKILLDEVQQLLYNLGYRKFQINKTSIDCWDYNEAIRFIAEIDINKS